MGEYVRGRILRALGLGRVWVELEALSARLRRVERDVSELNPGGGVAAHEPIAFDPTRRSPKLTIPAYPPPPSKGKT